VSGGEPPPTAGDSLAPLSRLVRAEAHRVLSEAQLAPDPARVAEGWERRFIADGPRCEEAVRLYAELGFEVCADPVRPEELAGECAECQVILRSFKTIYTRAPQRRG
jgi:hypothetical protein